MGFEKLGLNSQLVDAVLRMGFEQPTPIQKKAIPEIIEGTKDLVGLAQTGTGKTAAFGLPMVQLIDFRSRNTQGLVICPTRELCLQITKDFNDFCSTSKEASIVAVYGGASISDQIRLIKKGAHVIVATPGRLLDLMNRKVVNLSFTKYLVLDEADEMLNMGFQEDLDSILNNTPKEKRTWLFSATMPAEVSKIASKYMHDPVEITVGKKNSSAANIEHVNYVIKEKDRYQALKRVIDFYPDIYGLIFCRTRIETQEIAEKLLKDGYDAEALHGDLSQAIRDKVMGRFREKNLQILVATDVAARGIDVKDITHVIHYKLPDEIESYTHRSGRTARAGKSGVAIVLMNTRESRKLQDVERKAGIRFTQKKVPGGTAVCEKQLFSMVGKLVSVEVNETEIGRFLPPVYDTLAGLSREELIKRFVSLEFNRFLTYYQDSEDINVEDHKRDKRSYKDKWDSAEKKSRGRDSLGKTPRGRDVSFKKERDRGDFDKKEKGIKGGVSTRRFFASAGDMDNLNKGALVRLICDRSGIRSDKIGTIEIMREFSFFDVDATVADRVKETLKDASLDGRKLTVDYAAPKAPSDKKDFSRPEKRKRPGRVKKKSSQADY
ncbi:MAG: DEAD/DEAH box helicase [Proteobacteria bacterium]|nr:DEAD/DEAH box helicase [Pseudomonadota bacterium]